MPVSPVQPTPPTPPTPPPAPSNNDAAKMALCWQIAGAIKEQISQISYMQPKDQDPN